MFALYEYREHMKIIHPKYKCEQCQKICASSGELKNHIASHSDIRDYACENCDYKAKTLKHLNAHEKVCTGRVRISSGELAVKNTLEAKKIAYCREKSFRDCKDKNPLPFDFYLLQHNAIIEYDGEQHFGPIKRFRGQKGFEKTQRHDVIKNAYCVANNIQLLRIKYTDRERVEELISAFLETITPIIGVVPIKLCECARIGHRN
jgi:very-short-patch-repair endonuclease